jgi:hypothetical protein
MSSDFQELGDVDVATSQNRFFDLHYNAIEDRFYIYVSCTDEAAIKISNKDDNVSINCDFRFHQVVQVEFVRDAAMQMKDNDGRAKQTNNYAYLVAKKCVLDRALDGCMRLLSQKELIVKELLTGFKDIVDLKQYSFHRLQNFYKFILKELTDANKFEEVTKLQLLYTHLQCIMLVRNKLHRQCLSLTYEIEAFCSNHQAVLANSGLLIPSFDCSQCNKKCYISTTSAPTKSVICKLCLSASYKHKNFAEAMSTKPSVVQQSDTVVSPSPIKNIKIITEPILPPAPPTPTPPSPNYSASSSDSEEERRSEGENDADKSEDEEINADDDCSKISTGKLTYNPAVINIRQKNMTPSPQKKKKTYSQSDDFPSDHEVYVASD